MTKTLPAERVEQAYQLGFHCFGENKVLEAKGKYEALQHLPIHWILIGHLQSNKVKYVAKFIDEFHALDSIKLAEKLNHRLVEVQRILPVFIQVNTSNEQSKVRRCFQTLRLLRDDIQKTYPDIQRLSMGMSGDFEIAIEEGATDIRVGQAIFGARALPDNYYWSEQ